MIRFGPHMIFPDAWGSPGPYEDEPDIVTCTACGEDRYDDGSPCEHCGDAPEGWSR